ncbi:mitochondrial distribution and morphology protein 34 [Polytolypa hystricis UAMH7299]|uniref:Mitochondrial distribution and morphology protein 34 n=1 Tax=Polytolypa hystricis (strain UAMH7299) TaxID=1447883 RepID=A0A2B7YL98_POLH7|nr:mitochondrial distribution and morphology protein 34 [Polytolypa hystricis UAMH7299]
MAFNFNWSPLMADAGFYTRAQDLLTAALNKSPKPPIIVDDIVVTELNLGSIPPELEILEIGDLAEDRFRGIFKMSYSGDAFLTLKTRVQANPLNTYLVTRPAFASPQPLAAAAGLTIPLQITLSNFRLSGFVILVFSKQKGITVVFRNDPLESLKVSSTFDSIPFVRDYLQKEIEGQLRILFMDELPAIIHRLSLRLWGPDKSGQEIETTRIDKVPTEGPAEDPLLNPPQDPVDSSGKVLSMTEIASLSLDSGVEMHSLFSQKNLLRLGALTDSQRTLSLFTPSICEVVYRAWSGPTDQAEGPSGIMSPKSPPLSRTHSHIMSAGQSFQDTASIYSSLSRPSLPSSGFSGYGLSMGASRHSKPHSRKRKKRVVDLRRPKANDETSSVSGESMYTETTSTPSVFSAPTIPEEHNDDPVTPPATPGNTLRMSRLHDRGSEHYGVRRTIPQEFTHPPQPQPSTIQRDANRETAPIMSQNTGFAPEHNQPPSLRTYPPEKVESGASSQTRQPAMEAAQNRSILEQAWRMKLAGEIARRIQEEKAGTSDNGSTFWDPRPRERTPPPAYRHRV